MAIKFTEVLKKPTQEAILLLENEHKETGDVPTLRNLNLILLDLGQWQRARNNCERIIEESEHTHDRDFIEIGMVDWFMGNTSSAVDFWKRSMDTQYADAAGAIDGPLVLWYAGRRLGDEKLVKGSLKNLKKFWKIKDYRVFDEWPGGPAIAGFLMDKVPEHVFLNKWKWRALEYRRLCRANFWVGMKCLDRSEDEAINHFRAAFSTNKIAILEYEYFLAKWEYSRLTKNNKSGETPSH